MQKSYFLVKKVGRLVHSAEDELFSELETTSGASVRYNIWFLKSWRRKDLSIFYLFWAYILTTRLFMPLLIDGFIN